MTERLAITSIKKCRSELVRNYRAAKDGTMSMADLKQLTTTLIAIRDTLSVETFERRLDMLEARDPNANILVSGPKRVE